jgi:hypothetical protein
MRVLQGLRAYNSFGSTSGRAISVLLTAFMALCAMRAKTLAASPTKEEIEVDGGKLTIQFESVQPDDLRKLILDRINLSAKAVAAYYQKYPVPEASVWVAFHDGSGVNGGHAFGSPHPHLTFSVGRSSTAKDLADDWVSTHEMVHLAFPSVPEQQHWIEEGLATYVEPIARARIGELSPEKVWGDMLEGMPNGLPRSGDRGLDFTHTWGRTYWGGALFCLLADIEIRKSTGNTKGLEDALRGILKAGGNISLEWPLARTLEIADRATGVQILEKLYDRMGSSPEAPDLAKLWQDLGVVVNGKHVVLNDSAPLASIREAITQRHR